MKRKVHWSLNLHPYAYAYYIFCYNKEIFEYEYDQLSFSDDDKKVTCKRCLKHIEEWDEKNKSKRGAVCVGSGA